VLSVTRVKKCTAPHCASCSCHNAKAVCQAGHARLCCYSTQVPCRACEPVAHCRVKLPGPEGAYTLLCAWRHRLCLLL
jgi:hypothetical protein